MQGSFVSIILIPLIELLVTVINIYSFIVVLAVIVNWMVIFGVINTRNQVMGWIVYVLGQLTEPVFRPIRQALPSLGGIDISPIVVLLGLQFLGSVLVRFAYSMA